MSKAERGTKRVCGECGAKFYDLSRDPIVCPICEAVFVVQEPTSRAKPAAAKKPPEEAEKTEKAEKTEPADAEDTAAAAASGPEIVSLSDVEADESSKDDAEDIDIDLGDDADIPDDDDDDGDTFLETDDEDDSGVSDIIPGSVKPGEEEV